MQLVVLGALAVAIAAQARPLPDLGNLTPNVTLTPPLMFTSAARNCAPFVEPFDVDDYSGPLNGIVARFSQRVESATVHVPHHHGLRPCAMTAGDKFRLFVQDNIDPLNFAGAAWTAGEAQLEHEDPTYRQGMGGFSKRYGAALADNGVSDFFGTFLYPAAFHQDPRYYRLGQGSFGARLGHALAHRFVAQSDSGHAMFNFSEWMGTASSKALGNLYHPGNERGFAATATRVGFSVSSDMAWDVLREFWPEVAHKFKLPFRTHEAYAAPSTPPQPHPTRPATPALPTAPDGAAVETVSLF